MATSDLNLRRDGLGLALLALVMIGLLALAAPVMAEEETTTSTDKDKTTEQTTQESSQARPLLGSSKPAPKKGGLAAFAASAQLKGQSSEDGSVKISNNSLSETSGGGTMSVGGGVTAGGAAKKEGPESDIPQGPTADEQWSKRIEEQERKIESMEKGLVEFDKQVEENRRTSAAHNRAPGTRAPDEVTRERVQKEIAAEKARLDDLRRQAKREGAGAKKQ